MGYDAGMHDKRMRQPYRINRHRDNLIRYTETNAVPGVGSQVALVYLGAICHEPSGLPIPQGPAWCDAAVTMPARTSLTSTQSGSRTHTPPGSAMPVSPSAATASEAPSDEMANML